MCINARARDVEVPDAKLKCLALQMFQLFQIPRAESERDKWKRKKRDGEERGGKRERER